MLELFNSILLDKTSSVPLYMQLYDKLKEMILSGLLLPDLKLPSIRQLSAALQINQVTVVSAYKQLENEGYAYSKTGSGTYVANTILIAGKSTKNKGTIIQDELYQQEDISLITNGQIKIDHNTIDFASATPTPDLFPVEDFKIVLNQVLERDKGNAFGYQESQGYYALRESICATLGSYKIPCSPDNVQIISGAQQGIDIISKAFLRQGDCVITESPTYTGAIAVFKSRGAEIVDIEMLKDGPDLNVLEYSIRKYKPKLVYTIPSFQNPTGYSYSNYKRAEVLKLAERYNFYVIEDDYVSDLDFDQKGFMSLKSMDKNNRVIFIKSFSKIFMPGLRLGFMIVPPNLQGSIIEAKHTTDISTSGLIQRAFDLYFRNGFWDKHFKFMHEIYKERYFEMIHSLDAKLPQNISFVRPGGGLNIWLNLPYGFPVESLFKSSSSKGIVFAPGRIFYSNNSLQKYNSIRLSFAAVYTEQISNGISELCDIIHSMQKSTGSQKMKPIL